MALARVLIVESDASVARLERKVLEAAGYDVRVARSGSAGLAAAEAFEPDVVILDAALPDRSGFDVCATLAKATPAFILLVSSRSRQQEILRGLERGADDCITRPFSGNELVARVASFLRRRRKIAARSVDGNLLDLGASRLDRNFHTLSNNGSGIVLTALEFRLLWFLGEAEGRLFTRAQILETVWNDTSGVPTRVVDVHIAALRKKLARIRAPLEIASVRGIGYRLDKK
ncbi:MAG: response regulator transcription factor [Candidatus Eremiobacteraeota bacterium]|nr:response regulator transcription factor [Candidatus Eremiobacteraeota bacterium]